MALGITRLRRLGVLSFTSLLAGGAILIFFGANVLTGKRLRGQTLDASKIKGQEPFTIGSHLSVKSWLAVAGRKIISPSQSSQHDAAIGCGSYGGGGGLDYARYLNSQPRPPVTPLGFRAGYPTFILLRYLVVVLGTAASIGYKFTVINVTVLRNDPLDVSQVLLKVPPLRALESGVLPEDTSNMSAASPPYAIAMVG
ncbi:hypothetical protein B0H66DRAFT_601202 [Apodospora peruviana]|uniref:Uncharacterized protein n=1 Tax=Apodospora peruviana TaxID=516989 RepID=A0AAE0IB73_9PEZI|nr:hypothetical protein B0H66DRAFT_601202 [Apodospora peruviana]